MTANEESGFAGREVEYIGEANSCVNHRSRFLSFVNLNQRLLFVHQEDVELQQSLLNIKVVERFRLGFIYCDQK